MGKKVDYMLSIIEDKVTESVMVQEILTDIPMPKEFKDMRDEALMVIAKEDSLGESSTQLIVQVIKLAYVAGVMEGKNSVLDDVLGKVEHLAEVAQKLQKKVEEDNKRKDKDVK